MANQTLSRTYEKNPEETKNGNNKPLVDSAYHRIKELIFQHKLVPEQRLIYKDLCQMLKISRTPIINALSRLEEEGYVKSQPYCGFYVQPVDLEEISDHFGVREALEVYAVEQAVNLASPEEIIDLEASMAEHRDYMPPLYDKKKFYLDAGFHIKIAKMSRNQGLVKILTKNLEHIYLRLALDTFYEDRMAAAVGEHLKLVEMIKQKDVPGCIDLIRKHIQKSREHVIARLKREEVYQSL